MKYIITILLIFYISLFSHNTISINNARCNALQAFTALSGNLSSLLYNSAGLTKLHGAEFELSYSNLYTNISNLKLSNSELLVYVPYLKNIPIAIGIKNHFLGGFQYRINKNDAPKNFNRVDNILHIGAAYKYKNINIGINAKIVYILLSGLDYGIGYGGDLGLQYDLGNSSLGLNIYDLIGTNIISKGSYYSTNVKIGYAYYFSNRNNFLTIDTEFNKLNWFNRINIGFQYTPAPIINLMAGVSTGTYYILQNLKLSGGFVLNITDNYFLIYSTLYSASLKFSHNITLIYRP